MAAYRYPLPCGAEIGFGSDGILVIAQVVGGISKQLDQRDADIGYMPLLPIRHRKREPVVNELTKTCVILRKIVNVRNGENLRWAWLSGAQSRSFAQSALKLKSTHE